MAHGFTTTINGMTADKYAERLDKQVIPFCYMIIEI